jgi:Tfp pilus assembly protein PilF
VRASEAIERAERLRREKRFDEAAAALLEALDGAEPGDRAELHYRLGNVRIDGGDLDGAETSYTDCLAIDANHADAMNNLAVVYRRQGRRALFTRTYRRALWLTARNPRRVLWSVRLRTALRWALVLGLAVGGVMLVRWLSSG